MNEELIRQCARDTLEWFSWPTNTTAGKVQAAAEDAIRLYHALHVAPIRQENEELRALVKQLTAQAKADGERIGRLEAKVAPLVEAAEKIAAINLATDQVPHEFGWWVLQLRAALAPFQQEGPTTVTKAAADVLAERRRQIEAEGWTPEHDDKNESGDMARAAACYALVAADYPTDDGAILRFWPWLDSWWKPSDHRRNLVKAGALILAEIERLDRAAALSALAEADGPFIEEAK